MFNAPWPAVVLAGSIVAAYAVQTVIGSDALLTQYGVSAGALGRGDGLVLITSLYLHASWAHALGNAVFGLAFATPVARRMGGDAKGVVTFAIFYLLCGAFSGWIWALCQREPDVVALGASGGLAGFMGAASRLMVPAPGLAPFFSRTVVSMAAVWVLINLLFGTLLVGWAPGSGGLPMGWQAHIAGYAAGLLLIGPVLRGLGRR